MSDNTIVVINERIGDYAKPSLIIIALSSLHELDVRAMTAQLDAFRSKHPQTPPILLVGNDGTWTAMQTDNPESVRLADELREAVGIP